MQVPQKWDDMVRYTVRRMEGAASPAGSASPPRSGRGSPALLTASGEPDASVADASSDGVMMHNKNLQAAKQQLQQQRPGSPLRPS